jgi:putative alpha-1,2-mannosidase
MKEKVFHNKKKYNGVKLFWEHNCAGERMVYFKDWGIYRKMHPLVCILVFEELFEEELEIIYKAHKKAVNET